MNIFQRLAKWLNKGSTHDHRANEIKIAREVSPLDAWGAGAVIDLTEHGKREKINVYRCAVCGRTRYERVA